MVFGLMVNSALPTSLGATVTVTDDVPTSSNQSEASRSTWIFCSLSR